MLLLCLLACAALDTLVVMLPVVLIMLLLRDVGRMFETTLAPTVQANKLFAQKKLNNNLKVGTQVSGAA